MAFVEFVARPHEWSHTSSNEPPGKYAGKPSGKHAELRSGEHPGPCPGGGGEAAAALWPQPRLPQSRLPQSRLFQSGLFRRPAVFFSGLCQPRLFQSGLFQLRLCLILLLVLAGCGGDPPPPPVDEADVFQPDNASIANTQPDDGDVPPPLEELSLFEEEVRYPNLQEGDRFVFDNPQVEWEVIAVRDNLVIMVNELGDRFVRDRNILLPPLEWESWSQGSGRRVILDSVGTLFPLSVGARIEFRTQTTVLGYTDVYTANWECEVLDEVTLKVGTLDIDTYEVVCLRNGADQVRQYYAPSLNYIVRYEAGGVGTQILARSELIAWDTHLNRYVEAVPTLAERVDTVGPSDAPVTSVYSRPETGALGLTPVPGSPGSPEGDPALATDLTPPLPPLETIPNPQVNAQAQRGAGSAGSASGGTALGRTSLGGLLPQAQAAVPPAPVPPGPSVGQGSALDATGSWGVHVYSYRDLELARNNWSLVRARFAPEFDAKNQEIRRVNLPGQGIFYRTYAWPFTSQAEAEASCRRIRQNFNISYCRVVRF